MRVLLITTSLPSHPGDPSGHFVASEAIGLVKKGHDVTVIAPGRPAPIEGARVIGIADGGAFGWPGALARLRERPSRALGMARFVEVARRKLQTLGRIDRVIAHWLIPSGYPIALSLRTSEASERSECEGPEGRRPRHEPELEVVAHGSDVRLLIALPARVRGRVVGSLLDRGARFRFVSAELREALCRGGDRRLRDASCVELPDLDLSLAVTRAAARHDLGIGPRERVLMVVSRLVASKRVDLALGAAAGLAFDRLVVIGDGPERSRLERAFPAASFLGKRLRAETLAWISAADVLVSASVAEGAPTVIREARALGVPVVAAPAGDLRQWAERDPGIRVVAARVPLPDRIQTL